MTCAECGHDRVYHGDRAIVACDGGWKPAFATQMYRNWEREGPGPVCPCSGWSR